MSAVIDRPHLTDEDVAFTVAPGFTKRECVIPEQTLSYICRTCGNDMDCMSAFRVYEETIVSVAR